MVDPCKNMKNENKKIAMILNKKNILFLVILLLLSVPVLAEAAIGTGIFDFFTAVLEGISETTIPFKIFFVFLFFALLLSKAALEGSVWLLETMADPARMEIMESEMVQIGWQFTSSLANTAIIIILIVIGIATILNKDSYGVKKALPKLIIVALLVNFSLVLVGAVVDIANIILMTFFEMEIGSQITGALAESWGSIITSMSAYLTASMTAFAIPFSAPFAQIAFVGAMTGFFLPQIIDAVMQTVIGSFMAVTLFTYGVLFAVRVFVIQILAVVSPLAFIAWVLPKTRNLWERWFKTLVGWASLGIVLMFFLLLSTIAVAPFRPDDPVPAFGGHFSGQISSIFIYYLVLGVFLLITAKISKDFMPDGAQAIIDGGKQVFTGLKNTAAPMTKPLRESMNYAATSDKIEEREKRLENDDFDDGFKGVAQKFNDKVNLTLGRHTRRVQRARGKSPESEIDSIQGRNKDLIANSTTNELKRMIEGKGIKTGLKDHEVAPAIKQLSKRGDFDDIKETLVKHWNSLDIETQKELKNTRPQIIVDLAKEGMISLEEGKTPEDAMHDHLNSMSGSDVKDIQFKGDYAVEIATNVAKNPSMLQSLSSASYNQQKDFIQAAIDIDDEQAEEALKEYFSNPKNKEKWSNQLVGEIIEEVENESVLLDKNGNPFEK